MQSWTSARCDVTKGAKATFLEAVSVQKYPTQHRGKEFFFPPRALNRGLNVPLRQGCSPVTLNGQQDLQPSVTWGRFNWPGCCGADGAGRQPLATDAGGVRYPGLVRLPTADPETEERHMWTFCNGRLKYVIASKSWYGSDLESHNALL